ncbi:MAG: CHASE2 domain-containing protein [Candidatus Omnitrophica bacterium]|nr:CHASE2 domain-containing protein [Candidatus Omnitrophota bacterium]
MRKSVISAFILCAVLAGAFFWIYPSLPFSGCAFFDDTALQLYGIISRAQPPDRIIVVEITEEDTRRLKQQWPFSRALFARAFRNLAESEARVIGADILFAGRMTDPAADRALKETLQALNVPVIFAAAQGPGGHPVLPAAQLRELVTIGYANVPRDRDGVVRRARMAWPDRETPRFSFPARVAEAYTQKKLTYVNDSLRIGNDPIATQPDGTLTFHSIHPPRKFTRYSFTDIVHNSFPAAEIGGSIVLIGTTMELTHDRHRTAFGEMPGVYVHANIVHSLLTRRTGVPLPVAVQAVLAAGLILGVWILTVRAPLLPAVLLSCGLFLLVVWMDAALLFLGKEIPSGRILFSGALFLCGAGMYSSFRFKRQLSRIKNNLTRDPLTKLSTPRFFYDRIRLELKQVPRRVPRVIVVYLKGMEEAMEQKDYPEVTHFWRHFAEFLYQQGPVWTLYHREFLLGMSARGLSAQWYCRRLAHFTEDFFPVRVTAAEIHAAPDLALPETVMACADALKEFKGTVLPPEHTPHVTGGGERGSSDGLTPFFQETEQKNRALLQSIEQLKRQEQKNREAFLQVITSLIAALEAKDPYTEGHSQRVAKYSLLLAEKMHLSREEEQFLRRAALLHDLGKIGIPDTILHKRGALSEEEFAQIRTHGNVGVQILKVIREFENILPLIQYHHENYDGSGYPHGLSQHLIPRGARIIAVADVFDALTTGRSYKKAFTVEETVEELRRMKGKRLDPELVEYFIEALREHDLYRE